VQKINPRYLAGWVHEDICRRLERFSHDVEAGKSPRLMLLMPPRHGKACAVGTQVPTPMGFRPIESLIPGDYVFGRDGRPTRVVAVSPIWRDRELFEVTSDDGASVVVDSEHEWTVRLCRKRPVFKTKTTAELAARSSARAPALQTNEAAQFPEAALPIPPYVLGVWLGDGCSNHATITQGAQDYAHIRAEVEAEGIRTSDRATAGTFGLLGVSERLRRMRLFGAKQIPRAYLEAAVWQRVALLQGLIDTDGHVAPDGQVEFCSTNKTLAEGTLELVRSLGVKASMILGRATLDGRDCGVKYRVMFYMEGAARLPRKAERCRDGARTPQRFLSFRPAGRGDTVCIQVEAEDHQYLVGSGYLLTHNSELASRMFPSWHLGRCPDHEVIACSYNVSLAMAFSRKVKEVLQDPVYQAIFQTRLHPDFQAAEEWGIQGHRGSYVAAGVGGGITGKGAHILVIDDPIKNAEEADSADLREKLWDWYGSTAYTRLAPGGGVLVIQTWWHDDDLAGKLQMAMAADDEADQFEVIRYPAIAEADEWLDPATDEIVRVSHDVPLSYAASQAGEEFTESSGVEMMRAIVRAKDAGYDPSTMKYLRAKGEALHQARYDLLKLNRIKKTLPTRFWSALYQQNPVPDDGNYFTKDMFRRGKPPPASQCYVQIAWDFAISEKTHNDYTVGTVTLLDSDDMLWVVDRVKFRSADADFIVKSIVRLSKKWYSPSQILGCEDGQIYRALSALLKREMAAERVYPSLELLKPITDKQARGRTLQGRMQQGLVTFTDQGDWYDDTKSVLLRFPSGVHDDDVDSLAWNALIAAKRQPPRKQEKKRLKSWKDRFIDVSGGGHMAA
jgi:predicted phage terminase large subunit-like protein